MYAILCTSRENRDKGIKALGLVDRSLSKSSWWTETNKDILQVFNDRQDAERRMATLGMNTPRIVTFKKAQDTLDKQAAKWAAHRAAERTAHESVAQ